jgi:hypothetical protein
VDRADEELPERLRRMDLQAPFTAAGFDAIGAAVDEGRGDPGACGVRSPAPGPGGRDGPIRTFY